MTRAVVLTLAMLALGPASALAAFPGANGALAFPAGLGSIRDQSAVDLFSLTAKGATRRLAGGTGYQGAPAWSADGRRLAYASDGVLVVGSKRLALGRPAGEPAWAPDGSHLAFTSSGDVFTVRPDGRGVRRVTSGGGNAAPAWSPGGTQLAFISRGELVVARTDGTAVSGLADRALSADWAPDGRQIAFVRDGDVWTVPAAGGEPRRVTSAGDIGSALAWQPLARRRR